MAQKVSKRWTIADYKQLGPICISSTGHNKLSFDRIAAYGSSPHPARARPEQLRQPIVVVERHRPAAERAATFLAIDRHWSSWAFGVIIRFLVLRDPGLPLGGARLSAGRRIWGGHGRTKQSLILRLRRGRSGENIDKVTKLTRVNPPGKDLLGADPAVMEQEASRRPSLPRRMVSRAIDLAGDAITAGVGERGEPLRQNLKDLGRSVRGKQSENGGDSRTAQSAAGPSPMYSLQQYQTCWLRLEERFAVAMRLTHLVPGAMSPGGWAHVVELPLDRARELSGMLTPSFGKGSGWEKTTASCPGYINDIENLSLELKRLDGSSTSEQDAAKDTQIQVEKLLSDAQISMSRLGDAFRKLVEAAYAFYTENDQGAGTDVDQ